MTFLTPLKPRGLQQVHRALDVDSLVKGRLLEAGPHAGPRGEVDDLVELDAA